MPKRISDHTKNVKIYINLAPFLHEIIVKCKLALDEAFSFHKLSAWVIHQIVHIFIQSLS